MNVLQENERITHRRKDGSPSPWSIVFTVDRVNKEISHSLLPSRPTRLFMFLRNWNLLCLWVGQCYCQGFIGLFFKSFGRRVVLFFFSKKSLLQIRRWHSYLLKVRGNGRQAVFGGRSVVIPSYGSSQKQ